MTRRTTLHRLEWNGILLEITYAPQWMADVFEGEDLAHVEVQTIDPMNAALPITETGYRSIILPASVIAAAGGPVAYVDVLLAAESEAPAWREQEQEGRQLDLFAG